MKAVFCLITIMCLLPQVTICTPYLRAVNGLVRAAHHTPAIRNNHNATHTVVPTISKTLATYNLPQKTITLQKVKDLGAFAAVNAACSAAKYSWQAYFWTQIVPNLL